MATRSATSRRSGPSGTASTATPSATSGAASRRSASSSSRLAGSSDLYEHSGRRPVASINFVTAHDGFTLRDLVSYNDKHNDANGEDNNDGESHNRSWNHGVEGPTDDPEVLGLRARASSATSWPPCCSARACRCSLHGDELGRTQQGNNNTYAQDSELSWVHWDEVDEPLVEFTAAVARLRKDHPTFRRKRFFTGTTVRTGDGERLNDIVWLHPDGHPMEESDWNNGSQAIGMYLNGHGIAGNDVRGGTITDDHFLLYFNADGPATVTLPARGVRRRLGRRDRHRRQRGQLHDVRGRVDVRHRRPARCSCCASTSSPRSRSTTPWPRRWRWPPARPSAGRRARRSGDRWRIGTQRCPEAGEHLPAPDHRAVRPVRGGPAAALPARPRRRLGLPLAAAGRRAGQRPRVRRRRPRPRRHLARRARRGWPPCPPRPAGSGSACSSTSSPTTSAWPPRTRTRGGGTSCSTAAGPSTPRPSTSTGRWATAGSGSRWSATTTRRPRAARSPTSRWSADRRRPRQRRAALPRPPLPAGARTADPTLRGGADPDAVHARQHYELVNWRVADDGLNYRRFFAVNTLAAVRVEDPAVFADSHVEIRRWFDEGLVDGLRVDHPDGLRDPEGYLADLAELTGGAYVLVEKILETGEDAARRPGRPRAPPGTTRWRTSTGCSPTRPGSRRSTRWRPGCAGTRSTGPR